MTLGDQHRAEIEARRALVSRLVGAGSPAAGRVATAPPGYLLASDASDIARHCALLAPVPTPGEARVVLTPGRLSGQWQLDIAGRDRPGLLAAFTGVLEALSMDVVQAVLATWNDGGALQAYTIRSGAFPNASALRDALEASLAGPLSSARVVDARVSFDNGASPLYTYCQVRALDRPGLLHTLAVAFAAAGANVHAARATTLAGVATDHFDLSDRTGCKLHPSIEATIATLIREGVRHGRLRFGGRAR